MPSKPVRLRGMATGLSFLLCTVAADAIELRAIEDAPSIRTYRMEAYLEAGVRPRFQSTTVEGLYGKDPERYSVRVSLTEGDRAPVPIEARLAGGTIFFRMKTKWGEIEKFNLAESTVITPNHLLGIGDRLTEVGSETLHGREVVHLQGGQGDLPKVQSGSDSMDFSKMDDATVDLWVDRDERFIVKMHVVAHGTERGQTFPVDIAFEYSEFNAPVTIEAPADEDRVHVEVPTMPSQDDMTEKLGFEFPIPEGSNVAFYGATVTIVTNMPLASARAYAARSMKEAGFATVKEAELAPGEFYTDYRREGRALGVMVFQVSDRGATILVNATKPAPAAENP